MLNKFRGRATRIENAGAVVLLAPVALKNVPSRFSSNGARTLS